MQLLGEELRTIPLGCEGDAAVVLFQDVEDIRFFMGVQFQAELMQDGLQILVLCFAASGISGQTKTIQIKNRFFFQHVLIHKKFLSEQQVENLIEEDIFSAFS